MVEILILDNGYHSTHFYYNQIIVKQKPNYNRNFQSFLVAKIY